MLSKLRMHRRIVLRVIALLLLGAAVNVAVSWTLVFFAGDFEYEHYETTSAAVKFDEKEGVTYCWHASRSRAFGIREYFCVWRSRWERDQGYQSYFEKWARPAETIIPYWSECGPPSQALVQGDEEQYDQMEYAAGWPMLSLFCWQEMDGDSESATNYRFGLHAGLFDSNSAIPRLLPLHPIAIGFAVNTLFYAVVLWLPVLAFQTTRRTLRKRAGRCPKCGYDLRGTDHAACPECGTEICR